MTTLSTSAAENAKLIEFVAAGARQQLNGAQWHESGEAADVSVLSRQPRFMQGARHLRFHAALDRRNVRRPASTDVAQLVDVVVHGRDVQRVASRPRLCTEAAIIHPSGRGKTVTAHSSARLEPPSSIPSVGMLESV